MLGLFSNYNMQINFNVCNKLHRKIRRSWQYFPLINGDNFSDIIAPRETYITHVHHDYVQTRDRSCLVSEVFSISVIARKNLGVYKASCTIQAWSLREIYRSLYTPVR